MFLEVVGETLEVGFKIHLNKGLCQTGIGRKIPTMVLHNGTAGDTHLFCLFKIVYNMLNPCTLKLYIQIMYSKYVLPLFTQN